MNYGRIALGGIVGGIVYTVVSMAVNVGALGSRYELLQQRGIFRVEPRLPFLPIYIVLLVVVSMGLVWLYAAARTRLGPGPGTAFSVGVMVGLIGTLPPALAQFSWSHVGGFVSLWHAIEHVAGCALATLAGAWVYKEV